MAGKYWKFFRTGGMADTRLERIHKSLNRARGTAYAAYDDPEGTVVDAKNYAYAKLIDEIYESNDRLSKQHDPNTMGVFISRWEKILGISPLSTDSLSQRKSVIAKKMAMWTQPPNYSSIYDLAEIILGNILIEIEHKNSADVPGSIPGGETISNGSTLSNGDWYAPVASTVFRVWRPRTKDGIYLITLNEFQLKINRLMRMLDDYLPSYVDVGWYQYSENTSGIVSGIITGVSGSSTVTGSGTIFSQLNVGITFEVVDDDGNPNTYTVASIINDTELTVSETIDTDFTNSTFRILQFVLDQTFNLDNQILRSEP